MIESMKSHLGNDTNKFITYPKFVFLCGAAYSENEYAKTNRGVIDKYLKSKSDDIFIVLSEKLWEDSFDSNIDLLTFEEFLAEVSDAIILFVESPGSFCELGAFAYAEKLFSDKLIIVIDEKYKGDKSFIITGPTAKAKKDGAKVIYAPLSGTGLLSSADIRRIVDEKSTEFASKSSPSNKRHPNKDEASISVILCVDDGSVGFVGTVLSVGFVETVLSVGFAGTVSVVCSVELVCVVGSVAMPSNKFTHSTEIEDT